MKKAVTSLKALILFSVCAVFLTAAVRCEGPDGDSGFPLRTRIVNGDRVYGDPSKVVYNWLFWVISLSLCWQVYAGITKACRGK